MLLQLTRTTRTHETTIGELSLDGKLICHILEDVDRGLKHDMSLEEIARLKIKNETCIPPGQYEITVTPSTHLKHYDSLPLLNNVPGYGGIRIHPGNTKADTCGCLLPGDLDATGDRVNASVNAFTKLFEMIKNALKAEKVFINIA